MSVHIFVVIHEVDVEIFHRVSENFGPLLPGMLQAFPGTDKTHSEVKYVGISRRSRVSWKRLFSVIQDRC